MKGLNIFTYCNSTTKNHFSQVVNFPLHFFLEKYSVLGAGESFVQKTARIASCPLWMLLDPRALLERTAAAMNHSSFVIPGRKECSGFTAAHEVTSASPAEHPHFDITRAAISIADASPAKIKSKGHRG